MTDKIVTVMPDDIKTGIDYLRAHGGSFKFGFVALSGGLNRMGVSANEAALASERFSEFLKFFNEGKKHKRHKWRRRKTPHRQRYFCYLPNWANGHSRIRLRFKNRFILGRYEN